MPRSALALARLIPQPDASPADGPLLRAFLSSPPALGEDAFEQLVRRHGPMVLAACRRVLGNPHDADDAFQGTFLVLARKAGTIRGHLASWLYAVAVRTARGVRVMRDRRRKHELQARRERPSTHSSDNNHSDLAAVIDEELARLPEHHREAIVLCELRGLSRKDAAAELGIAEGTLSSRLAGGKRRLAVLLAGRGLSAPAVLVPLVAPAPVSAALVAATLSATRGTASAAASAAAGAAIKGMLFDQLRVGALSAAILLTAVCGGWAMTGSGAGDDPSPAASRTAPEDLAAKLAQLGATEFADREAAAQRLRALGLKAEPALKAGARSDNPEIRGRSQALLDQIRKDAREALAQQFNAASDAEPDHPIWRRFKSIAGNDAAARQLFAAIIADPRRLKFLDDADRDPARAGDLYGRELARWVSFVQKLPRQPNTGAPKPEDVPYAEAVAILYLGTYETSTGKVNEGWSSEGHLFIDSWGELMKSPVGPAVKRIFAAWLPLRDTPATRERGFAIAAEYRMASTLPFARKVLADEKEQSEQRAQAALLLGILGATDDLVLLRRVAESKAANEPFIHFTVVLRGQRDLDILWGSQRFGLKPIPDDLKTAAAKADIRTGDRTIADCAWAAAVWRAGGKPQEIGFLWPRTALGEKIDDYWFAFVTSHGFERAAARMAAHQKAREFLDQQKDQPKIDPAVMKLVERLGATEFADREAAQKALRSLGFQAESAIKVGLKSDKPEIRDRCARLLGEIRADARDALVKGFDPAVTSDFDHPLWKRFCSIAGNTRASRELFAQVIKNPNWLSRLDAVEANPASAAQHYREAIMEVGKLFNYYLSVWFHVPLWPCDRGEEVAFLLLLGSYPNSAPDLSVLPPKDARQFATGEGRIPLASGLELGLQGKMLETFPQFRPDPVKAIDGTGRVFARLLAAWLPQRRDPDVLWGAFRLAAAHGGSDVLPFARQAAADRRLPVEARCYALMPIARFGSPADRPLFEVLFADETVIAYHLAPDFRSVAPPGAKPVKPLGHVQARDYAAAHLLLLFGENPSDYGFIQDRNRVVKAGERLNPAHFLITEFAFPTDDNDTARSAAHAKVKAFLAKQPKPEEKKDEPKPDAAVVKLVEQLGAPEFADREAAQKELRKLGLKAIPALREGLRSGNAEVRARCDRLIGVIRADARDALAKQFDPKKTDDYDHPIWKHFVAIAGDSGAARELFAKIIANPKWLRTLDNAEADPADAGHIYRVGIAEMFRDFHADPTKNPPWPCDRPEEVAYLLLLGSHLDTNPPAKLSGDEVPPTNLRNVEFLGRGIIRGEEQIVHARGLELGLEGKWLVWQTSPAVAGTDRVFARLFLAWLIERDPASQVVPRAFRVALPQSERETRERTILAFARRIAANDFQPKREIPPITTITALEMVARFGTRADLPLFERYFGDETNAAAADKARSDGAMDYYRPAPLLDSTQMRDVALALALLLHRASPEDFGFAVRKEQFKPVDGRYFVPGSIQLHLGFKSDTDRAAAFKKAKEWLDKQKK